MHFEPTTGLLVEPLPEAYEALLTKKRKAFSIKTCLSTEKKVTEVDFDAFNNMVGGIINGQFKPAEESFQRMEQCSGTQRVKSGNWTKFE